MAAKRTPKGPAQSQAAKKAAAAARTAAAKAAAEKAKAVRAKAAELKKEQDAVATEIMQTKAQKTLTRESKYINATLEKLNKTLDKADDWRATLSVRLAGAEKICKEAKINFKEWAEANITQSYPEVRRLVKIGNSDDPVQAIADMRAKTAARVKKHADKKKAEQQVTEAKAKAAQAQGVTVPALARAFGELKPAQQTAFLKRIAKEHELAIATADGEAIYPTE